MKRIFSIITAAAIALSALPAAYADYSDVSPEADYYASAGRLQDLGIIKGYEDGTFRPENPITRAEFTKVVVCMMDKAKEAAAASSASGFYDVAAGSWSAPYINYAVSKDILSGYSDGSFGPNKTISFAEAVTILLRTLGYTEAEVGYYWPGNYVAAAASLGLTDGMSYAPDEQLTRADAAVLTDRALFTKPSAASAGGAADTYLEQLGCTVLDDALILDTDDNSSSVSLLSGNLKLSSASVYIATTQTPLNVGDTFEYAVIDKDGYLAAVRPYGAASGIASETVVVNRLTGSTIEFTRTDGSKGSYKADDSFVTYRDNSKMTFASSKSMLEKGVDLTFYGSGYGLWSIAVIGTSSDVDPVLASKNYSGDEASLEGISINRTGLTIYRDGEAAELSDIKVNDVVYYNTKTNTMDVYSKKVTGIYYAAYPSKAYIESVTVGGKSYNIGYSAAENRLNASAGAFEIGDRVTLLLGKDDEVAFCVDNSDGFDYFAYGVLLSNSTRIAESGANKGSTETVATLFMPDGQVHEIVTDRQYKDNIGELMRIDYSGGTASLTRQSTSQKDNYEGAINKTDRTINGKYVLKDAAIIQLSPESDTLSASCELLDFDNLTASEINSSEIVSVIPANGFGDIAVMLVKNFESTYTYGVIGGFLKTSADNSTVGYKIFSDGALASYYLNDLGRLTTFNGAGVGFKTQNGQLTRLVSLHQIAKGSSVDAVEGSRIMVNGVIYKMSADVQLTDITDIGAMRTVSVDELAAAKDISSVVLYSDRELKNGGTVRVVTFER